MRAQERVGPHGAAAAQVRPLRGHQQGPCRHQARVAAAPVPPQRGKPTLTFLSDVLVVGFDSGAVIRPWIFGFSMLNGFN